MAEIRVLEAFGEPIADGGQEAFVFGVLEKMDMEGLKIDCLTAYDCRSDRYRKLVEWLGGKVYTLNLPFAPGNSRGNIRKPFREFLKGHQYDVIHIHSGSISVLAIMAAEAGKAGVGKVIVHSHASGEIDNLKHKVLRFLASIPMSKYVTTYCACSKEAAEWKYESRYAGQIHIIKNGIDTERFKYNPQIRTDMRKQLNLKDSFVIGHVGRFTREKNHRFLVELFESILAKMPSSKLLLVGNGNEMEDIKSLISQKKLEESVAFTGSVTNVQDYLQAMDVFVLPSLFEGLGIVAVEAQCSGLPVVSSDRVPKDIKLTDDVTFISLEVGKDFWVDQILSYHSFQRQGKEKIIRFFGYDINQTAGIVKELYIDGKANS